MSLERDYFQGLVQQVLEEQISRLFSELDILKHSEKSPPA